MKQDVSRREFMKGAAGLAGVIAAGYSPSLYAVGANDRVRVACVGYSDRFRQSLLPCFKAHMKELNFDMVAVADLWKKRLEEKAVPGLKEAFESYKVELLSVSCSECVKTLPRLAGSVHEIHGGI